MLAAVPVDFAELAELEDPHAAVAAVAPMTATARQICPRLGVTCFLLLGILSSSRVSACPAPPPGRQH
jgi:hypothetical protein